jgi:hypothetical protein
MQRKRTVSACLNVDDAWSVQRRGVGDNACNRHPIAKQGLHIVNNAYLDLCERLLTVQSLREPAWLIATAHSRRPTPASLALDAGRTCSNLPLKQSLSLTLPELSSTQELLEGSDGALVMSADMAMGFRRTVQS